MTGDGCDADADADTDGEDGGDDSDRGMIDGGDGDMLTHGCIWSTACLRILLDT